MKHPNLTGRWKWYELSKVIPITDIKANTSMPWVKDGLSGNKDITLALMHELDELLTSAVGDWSWLQLSTNVPVTDILSNHSKPWNRRGISMRDDMTVSMMDMLDKVMTNAIRTWAWELLSRYVSIQDILFNPDKPWDKETMSMNEGMTIEHKENLDEVLTNAKYDWSWPSLSRIIPMEEIRQRPDLPWNKLSMSFNNQTHDHKWDKHLMSSSKHVTMEMVMANPD